MSEKASLPTGWTHVPVENLGANEPAALTDGPFGSNLKSSHYTDSGPRVIRLQNIGEGVFADERAHISEEHFATLRKHEARAHDVVIAMLGEKLPRACLLPAGVGPAIVKADCVRLRVAADLALPAYVAHGLNSDGVRAEAMDLVHGVGRPRLGLTLLRTISFPLAPLPEQHRIVDAIDSYFTRLDDAIATLERVQRNLKRYRASVLKSAVEGRLVPTEAELARAEGRDYEPASKLLARILVERRRRWEDAELAKMKANGKVPKDDTWKAKYEEPAAPDTSDLPKLPEGWCWASGEQVSEFITKGTTPAAEFLSDREGDVPYVKVYNLTFTGELDFSIDPTFVPMHIHAGDLARSIVRPGDVLMNIVGPPLGKVSIIPSHFPEWNINQAIARYRPLPGLEAAFLALALRSETCLGWAIRRAKATAGQFNLTLAICRQLPIPLPPVAEQDRIIAAAALAESRRDYAADNVDANLKRCTRLRQSILKWAFEGKLADQDPNDEPASVLLERIRAERAGTEQAKTARKPGRPAKRS